MDEAANAAQQAAIAINMKKHHKKPKNEDVMESLGDDFYLINGSEIRYIPEGEHYDGGPVISDDDFEKFYHHPEFQKTTTFAKQHYPSAPSKQQAFLRFVARSLMHSEEDDKRQDKEINLLMKRVNALQDKVDQKTNTQKSEKVDESLDYLEEK